MGSCVLSALYIPLFTITEIIWGGGVSKLMTVTSNTEADTEEEEGKKNSTHSGIETSFHTYILSLKLSGTPL